MRCDEDEKTSRWRKLMNLFSNFHCFCLDGYGNHFFCICLPCFIIVKVSKQIFWLTGRGFTCFVRLFRTLYYLVNIGSKSRSKTSSTSSRNRIDRVDISQHQMKIGATSSRYHLDIGSSYGWHRIEIEFVYWSIRVVNLFCPLII